MHDQMFSFTVVSRVASPKPFQAKKKDPVLGERARQEGNAKVCASYKLGLIRSPLPAPFCSLVGPAERDIIGRESGKSVLANA